MSSSSCINTNTNATSYNPVPTRIWSRFDNIIAPQTFEEQYNNAMNYKTNVLKHKNNESGITKKQQYSQIAKGYWTNKKSWATQTDRYTNPNVSSLQRVNSYYIPTNRVPTDTHNYIINPITGKYEVPDGGTLIYNVIENQETGELTNLYQLCNPISIINNDPNNPNNPNNPIDPYIYTSSTSSDIPGPITFIRSLRKPNPPYYPKNRTTYNTGGNKYPTNVNLQGTSAISTPSKCRSTLSTF